MAGPAEVVLVDRRWRAVTTLVGPDLIALDRIVQELRVPRGQAISAALALAAESPELLTGASRGPRGGV